MFSLTILASGSSGNCALVDSGRSRILIDSGLSARQMTLRLEQHGVSPESIDAIVLTHEHGDHSTGLDVWCKQYHTPIFCNPLTAEALRRGSPPELKKDWRLFTTGHSFCIGDISIESFTVPHDAADPVGFTFHCGGAALGFLTDLGFATRVAYERVREVHTLVIETNHDEKLLQNDVRRPWPVKQRIMSRHGHLSNTAAAEVVASLVGSSLRRVVLGHLSRDCNSPELALGAVRDRLKVAGADAAVDVRCAAQGEVLERMEVALADRPAPMLYEQSVFWS